jgi:DHA1 family bicyclomycin/chloramphenicol resistance-like MFS transporter
MVVRIGMIRLIKMALVMTVIFGISISLLSFIYDGIPPLALFVGVMFFGFFFIGILFGNLNSLAMIPVGHIAGVGAAFIGSFTSMLAVPIATIINQFLSDSIEPVAYGFLVFGLATFAVVRLGIKYTPNNS